MPANFTHFLSCDWGTTAFRLRLVALAGGHIVASIETEDGVKAINTKLGETKWPTARAEAFAEHLQQAAARLLTDAGLSDTLVPIVVSGMASSSIGWRELPYAPLPFAIDGAGARVERLNLELAPGRAQPILLISGVAGSDEMMRGEETQLIGLLGMPHFAKYGADSVVVLPGTHSKHIRVRDRQAVGLQTFMTGELFQVLSHHSVLRFTTSTENTMLDEAPFADGVRAVLARGLSRTLFQVRSRGVLAGKSNEQNRDYLAGLLIGDEVAALAEEPGDSPILLAMNQSMSDYYLAAARVTGIAQRCEAVNHGLLDEIVVAGQAILLTRFADRLN